MKLSNYAKKLGINYRTAWNWFKAGKLNAYKTKTGTIIVNEEKENNIENKVVIYCRVSSSENKSNLDLQAERLINYCNAKGYKVYKVIKEIGSGLNDKRKQLENVLKDETINLIVIEHKDRLARFGLNYINVLLELQNRKIEIVNNIENSKDDLMQDFVSIITSFTARLYGLRRSKRKTEEIIQRLKDDKDN